MFCNLLHSMFVHQTRIISEYCILMYLHQNFLLCLALNLTKHPDHIPVILSPLSCKISDVFM